MGGRQYRLITTKETGEDDAISVRMVRTGADNLVNLHDHVLAYLLVSSHGLPLCQSPNASATETLILYLGKHFIPHGYDRLRYWCCSKRTAGAGDITWKLIANTDWLYIGPAAYDEDELTGEVTGTWTTSADSYAWATGTVDVETLAGQWVWMYLGAANASVAERASVHDLNIQLEVSA